ncbi:MAG: response regulator [Epibacterium sp.]|nr:response regulator [Epibacterium sp.]NQX72007.1 response regulator [Epibacterium sp.]
MSALRKILLVEDDDFTRYMMREIIATLDIQVEIAESGQDGLNRLMAHPGDFCLVLMNLEMPDMSGIDATQIIRATRDAPPSKVPIIAVTDDSDFQDDAVVSELGMNGFVAKPLTPGLLLQLVDQYCKPS